MSDLLDIQPGEHGLVRVFTIDLGLDEAEALLENDAAALKSMTGASALDPDHIDLFDMNDLGGLPLADYLAEGHGIPEDELAPHRAQLDRVKGRVMVMRSAAFEGLGQAMKVTSPLRWIATFGESRDKVPLEKLRSETATGVVADPPVDPAPAGPRPQAGWIVGGVLALLALALLVWVFA